MKDSLRYCPSDKQAYRFLLLVQEAMDRTTSRPAELTGLTVQLTALNIKGQAPSIGDPMSTYRVMNFLRRKGSPKMSELARTLRVSLTTVTRIAEVLGNNGYVERLSDPKDGRIVRLTLTDSGRKAHDVIEDFILKDIRNTLDFLTAEEQIILITLVDKVIATLKKDAAH